MVKQIIAKLRLKVKQIVKQKDRVKGGTLKMGKTVVILASLERFERSTRCLEGSCSVQLSYRDVSNYSNVA